MNLAQIAFAGVPFDGWLRPGRRSHPNTGQTVVRAWST